MGEKVNTDKKYVYLHKNPKTGEIFYVGIGNRARAYHTKNRNRIWNSYTKKHGKPVVEIIFTGLSAEEAKQIEKELIFKYGRKCHEGGTLVNISYGGESSAGIEAWNKGKKLSKETCERMSMSKKGIKLSPSVIECIRKRMLGDNNPQRKKFGPKKPPKYNFSAPNLKGKDNPYSKTIYQIGSDGLVVKMFYSSREVEKAGFDRGAVNRCIKGKVKTHKGYKWSHGAIN